MARIALPNQLCVLGYGASSGFNLHHMEVGDWSGPMLMARWDNPIEEDKRERAFFWDLNRLDQILAEALSLIPKGAALSLYGWGADWMAVNMGGGAIGKPLHYATFFQSKECYWLQKVLQRKSKWDMFEMTGGASVDRYQLYTHMMWLLDHHRDWLCSDETSRLMSIADYITRFFSGVSGQDLATLQSHGLLSTGAELAYLDIFGSDGEKMSDLIRPWNPFDQEKALVSENRPIVIPCTHDSGLSRLWGSIFADLINWCGSFTGVAATIWADRSMLKGLFEAGFCLEGAGRLGFANANVHNWGMIWKALTQISGFNYDGLAKLAAGIEWNNVTVEPAFSEAHLADPIVGAKLLIDQFNSNVAQAARVVMENAVESLYHRTRQLQNCSGLELKSVAVTGGFAENRLYKDLIMRRIGSVVTPPFAEVATVMGAYVETICRIEKVEPREAAEILLPGVTASAM